MTRVNSTCQSEQNLLTVTQKIHALCGFPGLAIVIVASTPESPGRQANRFPQLLPSIGSQVIQKGLENFPLVWQATN
jgi:hypothetical protein